MINFFSEDIDFEFQYKSKSLPWLESIAEEGFGKNYTINLIFCSDQFLLEINKSYLSHDYYTDIITFRTSDDDEDLSCDIFISIERVKENSEKMSVPFEKELHRVMSHGLIHLMGYNDKTEAEKEEMRKKEDSYLSLLFN